MAYRALKTIKMGGSVYQKGHLFVPGSAGYDELKTADVEAGLIEEIPDTDDQKASRVMFDTKRRKGKSDA